MPLELPRKALDLPIIEVEGLVMQYVQTTDDEELMRWQFDQARASLEENEKLDEGKRAQAIASLEGELEQYLRDVKEQRAKADRMARIVLKPWTAHDRNLALESARDELGKSRPELMREYLLAQVILEWENLLWDGQPATRPTVEDIGALPRSLFDKLYGEAARISEPTPEYIAFLRWRQAQPSGPTQG